MKKILMLVLSIFATVPVFARGGGHGGGHSSGSAHTSHAATSTGSKAAHEHVNGYTKKDGTRVAAHDRSTKDGTKANNWSTKGNVNPETGKAGTK